MSQNVQAGAGWALGWWSTEVGQACKCRLVRLAASLVEHGGGIGQALCTFLNFKLK